MSHHSQAPAVTPSEISGMLWVFSVGFALILGMFAGLFFGGV